MLLGFVKNTAEAGFQTSMFRGSQIGGNPEGPKFRQPP